MKIAFYCPNKNIEHINFNQPYLGNPGCGATEYLQVAIPYMLDFYYGNLFKTIIIADSIKNLPKSIECFQVNNGSIDCRWFNYKIKKSNFFLKQLL